MLTKVVFRYSDGQERFLEGEEGQKWCVYNEQVAISAMIHGVCPPYDKLECKEGKTIEDEQKNTKENKE